MKLFGIIFLTGYWLAHENENLPGAQNQLGGLLREWGVYLLCSGVAVTTGIFLNGQESGLRPLILLWMACLPTIVFRGRPVCMIAGAATAFCILRFMPNGSRIVTAFVCVEIAVLVTAFLCLGARLRINQLGLNVLAQKSTTRLYILFSIAVLFLTVYQKMIQLF
jgi:hypothetical protein